MRKSYLVIAVLLTLLVVFLTGAAFAADSAEETTKVGKDTYFTLGYKVWNNTWQTPLNSYPPTDGANVMNITSESVNAPIISASLKMGDWLVAGSFMNTSDYKFPDYEDVSDNGDGTGSFWIYRTTASRKEQDINFGYYVAPPVALTLGWKQVKQTYNSLDNVTNAVLFTGWTKYSGPIIGVAGGGSIGGSFGFYGNLSYGYLKGEFEGDPQTFTAIYSSTEMGLAWRPWNFLSVLLGYKYQTIDSKIKDSAFNDQVAVDVTKGMIVGANLTF